MRKLSLITNQIISLLNMVMSHTIRFSENDEVIHSIKTSNMGKKLICVSNDYTKTNQDL